MNDRLKEAFNQIHADETIKNNTREFLEQKTQGYKKNMKRKPYIYAVCACLLLIIIGGYGTYFVPVSAISIDINPSFELSVNRFNRVISVNSINTDSEFAGTLDVKYKKYTDAVNQILESKDIAALLSDDEVMTITVTGSDESHSAEIFSEVEMCAKGRKNTYCYFSSSSEVAEAHKSGLSYGKYRAFLELQALDPDVTPETVQCMTMREIRDLYDRLSDGDDVEKSPDGAGVYEHGGYGNGCGGGRGKRYGNKNNDCTHD